jgi:hypothetical protein
MHSFIWVLVFGPPCLAFLIWQGIGKGSRTGDAAPWQKVSLGRFGYWIILTIIYTAAFATALVEHKI